MPAGSPKLTIHSKAAQLIARQGVIIFAHMEVAYSSNVQSTRWLFTNRFWHSGQLNCSSYHDGQHYSLSCSFNMANHPKHRNIPDRLRYTYTNIFFFFFFFFFFHPSSTRSARTGRIVHSQPSATQCRLVFQPQTCAHRTPKSNAKSVVFPRGPR